MPPANDLPFVRRVVSELAAAGIATWLFGGWAEELLSLSPPREHRDVDLLYPAEDFAAVDAFLATGAVDEIAAKRFPHKRAYESDGIMVELFLVRADGSGLFTEFWGTIRHAWPADLLDYRAGGMRVASEAALAGFRTGYPRLAPSLDGRQVSAEEWLRHRRETSAGGCRGRTVS